MDHTSPLSSGSIPVDAHPSKLLQALADFLIRRRILLSAVLFAALIAKDIASGVRPHDLANFRDPVSMLGLFAVLTGLALRSWAVGILRKDRELTTTGPYRLIRNPLYVGSFLMMFGFCMLVNDPLNIWLLLGPMLLVYMVKVRKEEHFLASTFPAEWQIYKAHTPRFLPRLARADLHADWRLAQWIRSREYHALLATSAALIAIQIWHATPQ